MTTSPQDDQFRLSGAWNFRDVGGIPTSDGRSVESGLFFRSSALSSLSEDGQQTLEQLGVTDVFDFRRHSEIEKTGADRAPDSVRVHHVPYQDVGPSAVTLDDGQREETRGERTIPDEATQRAAMIASYSEFPMLPGAKYALSSVFEALASTDGGVLVHCAAGKDRAGWTVATVLRALGVSEESILEDYLKSNSAVDPLRKHVMDLWGVGSDSGKIDLLTDAMLGVQEDYYFAATKSVDENYGSFGAYLEALGVTADKLERLRSRMLT